MDWVLIDQNIFYAINHFRNGFFDFFFYYFISLPGELAVIWFILMVAALIFDKKNGKKFFFLTLIAIGLTVVIDDLVIKQFVFRTRPYLALKDVYQLGEQWKNSSFPSGHASSAFAGIMMVYYFYRKYFKWALIFGILTLLARPYLGMHYPSDVLIGAILGIGCGWFVMYIYSKFYHPKKSLTEKIFDLYNKLTWKIKWIALGIVNFVILLWFVVCGGVLGLLFVVVIAGVGLGIYFGFEALWKWMRKRKVKVWITNVILVIGIILSLFVYIYGLLVGARIAFDNKQLSDDDKHLVIMVVDGASLINAKELFMEGQQDKSNYMSQMNKAFPNISKYFIQDGAFTANGVSVWPSSSIPAHTAIVTGNYPRETGMMGQRQFDAKQRKYTSYIGLGIQMHRYILDKNVKALCERFDNVRSLDVLQIANRGCSLFIPGTPHDEKVLGQTKEFVNATDALSKLSGKSEIPKIVIMTLPDIDHETHNDKISSEISKELYLSADKKIGEIIDLYKRKGLFDKTLFVLAADHGMGEVNNHVTLDNIFDDMRFKTYQSLKWKAIPAWGSFEANFYLGTKYKFNTEYNAVALWGGNSDALVYIKGQKRDKNGKVIYESWDIKPDDEQLKNYFVGGDNINILSRLFEYSPGIGLAFTNPKKNVFNVYSKNGQGQITERSNDGQVEFSYRVVEGTDPLGYSQYSFMADYIKNNTFLSDQEWLSLTYLSHYPDALRRIAYSFENKNSGNINIMAADGWDFTPWYVASRVLVGSHGSLNAQQSLVPIMFHGPGVKNIEMPFARTVDILPTILKYFDQPTDGVQGRVLPIFADSVKQKSVLMNNGYSDNKKFTCDTSEYFLESIYGTYDKRLVKIEGDKRTVLIESMKAEFPQLRKQVNLSADMTGIECGKEIKLREDYVAQNLFGSDFVYNLVK